MQSFPCGWIETEESRAARRYLTSPQGAPKNQSLINTDARCLCVFETFNPYRAGPNPTYSVRGGSDSTTKVGISLR